MDRVAEVGGVADVGDFVDALTRAPCGGTGLDPEVVTQFMGASRRGQSIGVLSVREREVLALLPRAGPMRHRRRARRI
jgi:hypothetical protein